MTEIPYCEKVLEVTGGCTKCSPGCKNCWAIKEVWRMAHNPLQGDKWQGLVEKKNGALNWTGKIKYFPDALKIPLRRKKPTKYFVDSKADLFHKDVPFDYKVKVFGAMKKCSQHTFLVFTKRIDEMCVFMNEYYDSPQYDEWPLHHRHIQLILSISTQKEADEKIPILLQIPGFHGLSIEPCLEGIDLQLDYGIRQDCTGEIEPKQLHLVIVGGESGKGARPMHPDLPRNIRDQCVAANVPYYFKQWGKWGIAEPIPNDHQKRFRIIGGSEPLSHNTIFKIFPEHANSTIPLTGWVKVGKKKAGRLLDGEIWEQLP